MASSTTPNPLSHHLHHLILLSLLIFSLPITRSDEHLMEQECHNANIPTICLQCLQSDPTSPQADTVGIARIIINCLTNHADNLFKNVSGLVHGEQRKAVKTALEECDKGFLQAKKDLSEAENGLTEGKYDNAGHSVRVALDNPLSCEASLKSVGFEGSPEVYYEMKVYEELSDAGMRIIDRL